LREKRRGHNSIKSLLSNDLKIKYVVFTRKFPVKRGKEAEGRVPGGFQPRRDLQPLFILAE
jgi:hypothetical protein